MRFAKQVNAAMKAEAKAKAEAAKAVRSDAVNSLTKAQRKQIAADLRALIASRK